MNALDLKDRQCRYPKGDEPPFDFCGAPIFRRPYCAAHYRVCYRSAAATREEKLVAAEAQINTGFVRAFP